MGSAAGYVTNAPACAFSTVSVNGAVNGTITFSLVVAAPAGFTALPFSALALCDPLGSPPSAGATTLTPCSQIENTNAKVLTGITINGAASVDETGSATYTAAASYSDSSSASVTAAFSVVGAAATLSGSQLNANIVTADQTVTLSATYAEGGISKSASQTVTIRNVFKLLVALQISGSVKVDEKSTASYVATAQYDDGSSSVVVPAWSLGNGTAASIAAGGVLTANRVTQDTTVNISASYTEGPTGYPVTPITKTSTQGVVIHKIFFDINLAVKWNLIGNGTDASWDVATLFGDKNNVVTVWKWLAAKKNWAFYTPTMTAQQLADYATLKGYDLLTTIDSSDGAWVNAVVPHTISVPMKSAVLVTSLQTTLRPTSWNLVSIGETKTPSEFNLEIAPPAIDAPPPVLGETPPIPINLTTLWAWDSSLIGWYFYAPSLEKLGGTTLKDYALGKGYLDFKETNKVLDTGVGFWVNMP